MKYVVSCHEHTAKVNDEQGVEVNSVRFLTNGYRSSNETLVSTGIIYCPLLSNKSLLLIYRTLSKCRNYCFSSLSPRHYLWILLSLSLPLSPFPFLFIFFLTSE